MALAPTQSLVETPSRAFYRQAMEVLRRGDVPFLVGGAFAFVHQAGIDRSTKDLDIFVRPADVHRLLEVCAAAGYEAELVFSHWLAKIAVPRRIHRRDLQLGKRDRRRGRPVVRPRHRAERAWPQRAGRTRRREHLVQGVRHGARAIRRGRCGAHHPGLRGPPRLVPVAGAVRRALARTADAPGPVRLHLSRAPARACQAGSCTSCWAGWPPRSMRPTPRIRSATARSCPGRSISAMCSAAAFAMPASALTAR